MANVVEIILKAKDQASKEVGGLSAKFEKLTGISIKSALSFGTFTAAVGFATDALKDSVKETVDYAKTVRDLSQNLNITTEETSRMIQVADDYGISVGSMETAMKMALKNGFAPTIDSLADAADKYLAIQDPTERAAELTKIYGRNWAELTPMLKEGGAAIREAAYLTDDSLIITKEAADAAREYEIANDSLGDSLQAMKYTVGKEVIPPLTDLVNILGEIVSGTSKADKAVSTQAYLLAKNTPTGLPTRWSQALLHS